MESLKLPFPFPRVLNPELFDAMSKPRFVVGEQVDLKDPKKERVQTYGPGPFKVVAVRDVQKESLTSVGHRQWVQLSKMIPLNGKPTVVVYDSFREQWTMPDNISYFGGIHPTELSGAWIKPFHQEKK